MKKLSVVISTTIVVILTSLCLVSCAKKKPIYRFPVNECVVKEITLVNPVDDWKVLDSTDTFDVEGAK